MKPSQYDNLSITAPFSIKLFIILLASLALGFFAIMGLEYQTRMTLRRSFSDNYARFLAGQMSRLIGDYAKPELWEAEAARVAIEIKKRAPVSGLSGILLLNKKKETLGRIPAESECRAESSQGSGDILVNNELIGYVMVCLESSANGLTTEVLSLLNIGTLTSRVGADYSRLVASQIEMMIDQMGHQDYWEYSPGAISNALSAIIPLQGVTSVAVFNRKGEFVALEYLNDSGMKPAITAQSGLNYKGQNVGQVIVDIDFPELRAVEISFQRYLIFAVAVTLLVLFAFPVAIVRRLEKVARTAYRDLQVSHTQLEETQLKLVNSAKMAALGTMAGGIAHEINNPLVIIIGNAEFINFIEDFNETNIKTVKARTKKILDTAFRIAKIIKSLKALAREGESDPFVKVSVSSIIDETLELCGERARNFGINLGVSSEPAGALIEMDCQPIQISQVLLNLVNNACEAIEDFPEKWVHLHIKDELHIIQITITDSGNGITEELRTKLFRPFFTTKAAGKGTGLGLSISLQIIESHGGTLDIDMECKNTRFVITLPKKQTFPVNHTKAV